MPTEKVALQKVGLKDMRAVVDFLREFGDVNEVRLIKNIEARIHSATHLMLLARIGKVPVGLIECAIQEALSFQGGGPEGTILFLGVAKPHRRNNIATRLLEAAGFWFSANSVGRVRSEIPAEDKDTRSFFKALGYRKSAVTMTQNDPARHDAPQHE